MIGGLCFVRGAPGQGVEVLEQMIGEYLAEDHGLCQGVTAETVGPMYSGGGLADGVEPGDGGPHGPEVYLYAAHRVVGGRRDLHRLAGYVYPETGELLVHPGQALLYIGGVLVGDV